jgi:hypothetical protein
MPSGYLETNCFWFFSPLLDARRLFSTEGQSELMGALVIYQHRSAVIYEPSLLDGKIVFDAYLP